MNNIKTPPRLVDYSSDEEQYLENDSKNKTQEILPQNNSKQKMKSPNFSTWSQNEWFALINKPFTTLINFLLKFKVSMVFEMFFQISSKRF